MTSTLGKDIFKAFLFAAVSLFLIPLLAFVFVGHAEPALDAQYLGEIERAIDQAPRLTPGEKSETKAFFRANPPSRVCDDASPKVQKYRGDVCGPYSQLWQFHLVRKVSFWTMVASAAVLLAAMALGAIAFVNRRSQYLSFTLGWTLLTLASVGAVVVQGSLAVWLSFWVTAFFFHSYYIKLIAIAGIAAAIAVLLAIVGIFKRPPQGSSIDGELVSEADSPALWARVREAARRMKTAPPQHIVAGIDTNFFVTQAPLTVGGRELTGRSLFVSLPLLRLLDRSEADAVLGHELAHFRGGDTESSARLGPKLVQYDLYCMAMREGAVTLPVFFLMNFYRLIFEVALKRDSREREYKADRTAAKLVSPQAIVHSLIKVAAYARYRSQTEQKLFEQDQQHGGSIGIAQHVAAGLAPYATSAHFVDSMKEAAIPHPFDSHPALHERMKNVGHLVDEDDYGAIVTRPTQSSWITDILTAEAIEQRLWSAYEQGFAAMHEQSLAYRYEPANEAEAAIVLKYFPPVVVDLKGGKQFHITCAGIILPEQQDLLPWDSVDNLKYEDGIGGDVLEIIHPEKTWRGNKSTKVKLPGISKQRDAFKSVLGRYWQRHQVMRKQSAGG